MLLVATSVVSQTMLTATLTAYQSVRHEELVAPDRYYLQPSASSATDVVGWHWVKVLSKLYKESVNEGDFF